MHLFISIDIAGVDKAQQTKRINFSQVWHLPVLILSCSCPAYIEMIMQIKITKIIWALCVRPKVNSNNLYKPR